jgi:hypothetical protein
VHDTAATPEPAQEAHPEAQFYFAMNGSEPAVVSENPYAPEPESAAAAEQPPAADSPAAKPAADNAGEPSSVKVIFPHDHG